MTLHLRLKTMLNRSAFIVRYRQPFVDWINEVDPYPRHTVTLERANDDATVYLVDVDGEADFSEWIRLNHGLLFEELLNDWYTDPSLWPQDRSYQTLQKWCSFEFHSLVLDTGGPAIEDDDAAPGGEA